jgi:hypothetical protein
MHWQELFKALGHSPSNPLLGEWLDRHLIYDRPHTAQQDDLWEEDEYEAEQSARASEIEEVERHSLCLIYEERDNYERLWGEPKSEGDFVLKQFVLYAPSVQGYSGFKGELPFGLRFDMNRDQVHAHLGRSPLATRQLHELWADLFVTEQIHVNVSYLNNGQSIGILHVRLPHRYDLRMLGLQAPPVYRTDDSLSEQLTACLGCSAFDTELDTLLVPLGWHVNTEDITDCNEVTDLMQRVGLTLYYRDASDGQSGRQESLIVGSKVFEGFRLNRAADMYSQGFEFRLPHGLEFHHAPSQVIEKMGRKPDWQSVGDDTAALKWNFEHCSVHVLLSLIDNQLYRVTCFAARNTKPSVRQIEPKT